TGQHAPTVGIRQKRRPGLCYRLPGDGGHQDNIEFGMIHMRSCKGTPTMSRGRLVERPEKRRGLVGSSFASAQGGHLLILEGGAFAGESTLPNGSNAFLQALFTIQPK